MSELHEELRREIERLGKEVDGLFGSDFAWTHEQTALRAAELAVEYMSRPVCAKCGESGHRLEIGLTLNGGEKAYRCPLGGPQEEITRAEFERRKEGRC